jgi:DNA-binding transcriptional ArsR family regulator
MTFGLAELLLDLIYTLQAYCKVDLESGYILLVVSDATMRPFMIDPSTPAEIMTAERPPNDIRGSISRRTIADKTGLPRETVRRKTMDLAARGLVQIDEDGRVRIAQRLGEPDFQHTVARCHEAVLRYLQRLKELGVEP